MIALIQRVSSARVEVDSQVVGAIGSGLLALVAVEPGDGDAQCRRMLQRLLGYRVFGDAQGKMNLSLGETGGGLLLVSQFTLAADTNSGMRPSFTTAAAPADGLRWFAHLVELARAAHPGVETGRFGAHMQVHLVNDGPVTFWLTAR
jgi:D-tyrosyl-tRNA(Tyr) deacylase